MYNTFIDIFVFLYDKHFPKVVKTIKFKDISSPWLSKGLKKSSKRKQRLYIKYLKKKCDKTKSEYKTYASLFEKIKKTAKANYYNKLLEKCQTDSRKTWQLLNEIIGKPKINKPCFPKTIKINHKTIDDENVIANEFNNFFVNIESKLASQVPSANKSFDKYLDRNKNELNNEKLTMLEFNNAFKILKRNKATGIDDINSNIIINCQNELKVPLFKIFKHSLEEGIFPEKLKTAKVKPIFKSGDTSEIGNYRPISILSTFSKILERIMHNRVYTLFK
ncbi:uncharacterized protein LOC136083107 [Hydra vulgaris]|uniref:Uncharacterized protein LOC136083107 n=1 Tax=Hydra vulgaris TaxID=6087 RepID=A0ABM4CAB5_HYDVU